MTIGSQSTAPRRRLARAAALLMVAALSGCAASAPSSGAGDSISTAKVPPDALQVGEDLYRIPVGHDADGCLMYRLFSPTTKVTHAVSYRSVDGGFTLKRKRALCRPDA